LSTVVFTVPVLLPGVGSLASLVAVALFVMIVPLAAEALAVTTKVSVAGVPTVTVPKLAVIDPFISLANPWLMLMKPAKVVFAGTVSVKTTFWASIGPLLATLTV
jgi:hypothetical protein